MVIALRQAKKTRLSYIENVLEGKRVAECNWGGECDVMMELRKEMSCILEKGIYITDWFVCLVWSASNAIRARIYTELHAVHRKK
jgi:hypothetical protein